MLSSLEVPIMMNWLEDSGLASLLIYLDVEVQQVSPLHHHPILAGIDEHQLCTLPPGDVPSHTADHGGKVRPEADHTFISFL